jgi:PAS domain-containing protein
MNSELENLKKLTETLTSDSHLMDQTIAWEYAFNSVTDLVCITNTSYQIKFLNTKFLEKLPAHLDFYINKTINELFDKNVEVIDNNDFSNIDSEVHYGETFLPEFGGWFIKNRYVIRNNNRDIIGFTYMFSDITDKKKAEARWRNSEARFIDLFKYMTVSAVVFLPIDGGKDFKIIDFNKAAEALEGVNRNEVVGKNLSSLTRVDNYKHLLGKLQNVFKTGVAEHLPTDYYGDVFKGGWREIFLMKLPYGEIVCLYTDETSKIEAQLELKHNEELLEGIFNVIPDIIGLQDANHNAIRYNNIAHKVFNVTSEELKTKKCYELLGRGCLCADCNTELCKKSKKPEKQIKYIGELGGWYDCRSYPIMGVDDEVEYVVEHFRDITELKAAQESREASFRKLRCVFQRLHFIIAAVNGYVWEKEVVDVGKELVYSYIDPSLCKYFYKLKSDKDSDGLDLTCYGAIGKTATELINKYCIDNKVHSFIDICTIADSHCIEQQEACDYFEMGYIEKQDGDLEWTVLRVRKEPIFDDYGEVVGLLGFADNCVNDMYSIKELIWRGLEDGSIKKLADTGKAKVYWIVKRKEEVVDLSYLDFP